MNFDTDISGLFANILNNTETGKLLKRKICKIAPWTACTTLAFITMNDDRYAKHMCIERNRTQTFTHRWTCTEEQMRDLYC